MIVKEREPLKVNIFKAKERELDIDSDTGLTEPLSKSPRYKMREAYLMYRRLGRPLTDEEMEQFRVS